MSILKELLEKALAINASDVHLKPNQVPMFRAHGELVESGFDILAPEDLFKIVRAIMPPYQAQSFEECHEADFSHFEEGVARFRVNVFLSFGIPCVVMRLVKHKVPTFEQLRIPEQLKKLADAERGIILLSGVTGSGKSTTLAAIIGEMNRRHKLRIMTVEDPIEYMFEDDKSIITQREVGLDTLSYEEALKRLLRQDPDVILVGEMRDRTSIRVAIQAAETGHLVMSTVHASSASVALPRMIDTFPPDEQDQIRMALAENLHAVVCQRLIPDIHNSVVPAVEILLNTPTVRKFIEKGKMEILSAAIETGVEDGMQTFNQSVLKLIKSGLITEDEGMRYATNPEQLRMNLQGIFLDEGKRILSA